MNESQIKISICTSKIKGGELNAKVLLSDTLPNCLPFQERTSF